MLNFLGVACPVCNKVLLLIFGWNVLMTYYEPIRIYVAAIGTAITLLVVAYEGLRRVYPPSESIANTGAGRMS